MLNLFVFIIARNTMPTPHKENLMSFVINNPTKRILKEETTESADENRLLGEMSEAAKQDGFLSEADSAALLDRMKNA